MAKKLIALAVCIFCLYSVCAAAGDYIVPQDVQEAAEKYGQEYDISPELLLAIMRYESCYVQDVSNGNCKGIMQINVPFHRERIKKLGITDIYDVDSNIHVGADYVAELHESYEDYAIVLGIYHGESDAIERAEQGNYSGYVTKVLKKQQELENEKEEQMEEDKKVCQNCAYAALRTDLGRFPWCKYLCTFPVEDPARHIAYKYKTDSCENFLATNKPDAD